MGKKIAYILGNSRKGVDEEWKKDNCFVDGELQKRVEKFGESHNILDIKFGGDDSIVLVIYED